MHQIQAAINRKLYQATNTRGDSEAEEAEVSNHRKGVKFIAFSMVKILTMDPRIALTRKEWMQY
jgi:hypothetical protein